MADTALTNRTYNETIKRADQYCKSKDYDDALNLYKKSLTLKPDLEYPSKQIVKLNRILELKSKISEKSAAYSYNKAMQLALKTVLNATYGAFANKYFVLSNAKIANAITAMGRDLIRYMIVCTEDYFYKEWATDTERHELLGTEYISKNKVDGKYYFLNKEYKKVDRPYAHFNTGELGDILISRKLTLDKLKKIEGEMGDFELMYEYKLFDITEIKPLDNNPKWKIEDGVTFYVGNNPISMYGDTDSSFKDTLIRTNDGNFTIEELYNKNISSGSAGNTLTGHESVNCKEKVLNWEEEKKLYYAPVKRIIRHNVTKSKWKLKTKSGKEIIVTNDHSMIVFRDGVKTEVKPCDVLKTDKILIINKIEEK